MKKAVGMFALGMFFLIALMSFSSAAYYGGYFNPYYGGGNYDASYSYNTRTSGSYYGPQMTTTTQRGKVSESYWNGYSWVDRTAYVTEKVQTPQYGGYGYYPGYNSNRNYGGYYDYGGYNYGNYNYGNYYGNFYPDYYGYNYPRVSYWG